MVSLLPLLGVYPLGLTLRLALDAVLSRHYASAEEFGLYQDIWRELRVTRLR